LSSCPFTLLLIALYTWENENASKQKKDSFISGVQILKYFTINILNKLESKYPAFQGHKLQN
jgi:hypothetical protein